jgi:hypothetical protein
MSKSIFIALPKKQGATDRGQHRTISLVSHVSADHYDAEQEQDLAEEQCGNAIC